MLFASVRSTDDWQTSRGGVHSTPIVQTISMQNDPLQALKDATLGGNKIEAVKLYRELFGVGLAEAKLAIEHMEVTLRTEALKGLQPPFLPAGHQPMPEPVLSQIQMCLLGGQKIAAIKSYREYNPVGLAEAKAVIDRMEDILRAQSPGLFTRPRNAGAAGCPMLVLLFALLAYGIWRIMH